MFQITSLLLFSVLSSAQVDRPSYETAYQKAQEEHKPLLIIVGADWCAACKTLKSQTIDPMQSSGKLQDVIVTVVDKDARPELAQQLMQGSSLPQLVVFAKGDDGWKKFSLSGLQSERRVQELLDRASTETAPRTAASETSLKISAR
jgi:thioredoxin-like negative regulator of GroEL